MLRLLDLIYSLPFFLGAVTGTVLWKLWCRTRARYEDRHHPLPDGGKHIIRRISRVWIAGLCSTLSLGYVVLVMGHLETNAQQLTSTVVRCWAANYTATKSQIDINAQNDAITRKQIRLQRRYDVDTSRWLAKLIEQLGKPTPEGVVNPEEIADATAVHQAVTDQLGADFDVLVQQRDELDKERANHPLPDSECGRS